MRCLILYAALFGAVAGYRRYPSSEELATTFKSDMTTVTPESSSSTTQRTTTTPEPSSSSSSTTSTTTQTNLIEGVISELPITLPPLLPQRHMVTYDQRQEGQYNIRADLDNFMIILVPPSPTQGLGLLDLLTKSSLRRTSQSTTKGKKKHYASASSFKPDALKNLNYFQANNQQLAGGNSRGGEFIDGRTPYHVDISSLNDEEVQPRLNPDRQVDVLPPPYPLAYQHHLMKPYHLEAESSLLPPSEMGLQNGGDSAPSAHNAGYYRFARYIRGDNFLDSNRLTSSHRLVAQPYVMRTQQKLPVFRPDLSMGADKLYPPLDVPQFNQQEGRSSSSSSSDTDDIDVFVPPADLPLEDDIDLSFVDDDLLEDKAKSLLSDGIERCAPGKRRDSYGVCREIEGY